MNNSLALLLEDAARRFPERTALTDDASSLTYAQLRAQARHMAAVLKRHAVSREAPLAVFLPKSCQSVVSFYAALYLGAPYAPLDYASPDARLARTLENLRPGCVVTDEAGLARLEGLGLSCELLRFDALEAGDADESCVNAALAHTIDEDVAYIMYTSGSTGTPKGVAVTHRGVLDYAAWLVETFSFTEETVFGLQSGFHFDNSVFDLYASVLCGGKVVIIPEILFMYPIKLMEYVAEKEISCIFWVPTVMISVANAQALNAAALPKLQTIVFAGEVMPNRQLNVWRRALPGRVFVNLYGPTEITVDCTIYQVDRDFADGDPLPIGYERPNMRVLLLKEDGTEAGFGEQGELCVLGSQLARGYWHAPEETARAFVPNPLNTAYPEPMYRTGDLAVRDVTGLIHFLGRRDSQIKLRGNRIEMGDIETAARALSGVTNACALFDAEAEKIVLFLETQEQPTLRRTNVALGKLLPKYMLPGELRTLPLFPLNQNRKVDRIALRAMLREGTP